jgi:predicted site-specific integrase-resolvase
MPATRKRAIIYCRVSTDKQEQDGESLEYQEEKGRKHAELHDMDVVIVLQEAKSGFMQEKESPDRQRHPDTGRQREYENHPRRLTGHRANRTV